MHFLSKTTLALALGAGLAVSAVAPAFAFEGMAPSKRGIGQGEESVQLLRVRGGARYHKLQTERQTWAGEGDVRAWHAEGDLRTGDTAMREGVIDGA